MTIGEAIKAGVRCASIALPIVFSTAANACSVNLPQHDRVRWPYDAVVIGTVIKVKVTPKTDGDRPRWEAEVKRELVLEGYTRLSVLRAWRSGESAECDDGEPVPKVGDKWTLYLRKPPTFSTSPTWEIFNWASYSLPLYKSIQFDWRFWPLAWRGGSAFESPRRAPLTVYFPSKPD